MNDKSLLEQFRDLEISRKELDSYGDQQLLNNMKQDTVIVCNQHVINLLEEYKNNKLTENRILEWVNTIWFSDAYDYCDEGSECIASIMNKLEEINESFVLDIDRVQHYINALEKNQEI